MGLAGSRYSLMSDTKNRDIEGVDADTYPDCLTYFEKLENFGGSDPEPPLQYEATSLFVQRPYMLTYSYYGDAMFDDLILTLNNISYLSTVEEGDLIYFPANKDVIKFYTTYTTEGGTV